MTVNVNYVIIVKGGVNIMRFYEKQALQATIDGIKYMQKMNFDKYVILNNLDSMIENFRVNASNDFIKCIFDIRQKVAYLDCTHEYCC